MSAEDVLARHTRNEVYFEDKSLARAECLFDGQPWGDNGCDAVLMARALAESEERVKVLEAAVGDALDLLGGMWSWSEVNGFFLTQTGWIGNAGHVLRAAAGRPAREPDQATHDRRKADTAALLEGEPDAR